MKKRIFAMLLSALLLANASACRYVPQSEIEEPFENTDTIKSNFEETDEKLTESETNAEIKTPRKSPDFYNGVSGNSNATYTFHQNGEFSLHIADWNEDHLIASLLYKDNNAVKYSYSAVAVNNERAFLILKQCLKMPFIKAIFLRV